MLDGPTGMLSPNELVPEALPGLLDHVQFAHSGDTFKHVHRRGHQTLRTAAPVVVARRGQVDAAGRVEIPQSLLPPAAP